MKRLLVTIDGPGGAGKTTISRMLAEKLEYRYIDTGALYRGIALAVKSARIDPADESAVQTVCRSLDLRFVRQGTAMRLFAGQRDISDEIRTPAISMLASAVSAQPNVRQCLLGLQRELGRGGGAVFEGRDMGTVVFPAADVKFFLDASLKTRALRRYRELLPPNLQPLAEVERDMARRDKSDSSRALAPLKPAADAIIIDSSELSIDAVAALMLSYIKKAL